MSSLCAYCDLALEGAPSRACPRCGDLLHAACLAQCAERNVPSCGHRASLVGCAFVSEHALVSLDSEGALRSWDLHTGRDSLAAQLGANATHLFVSADRARLVVAVGNQLHRIDASALGERQSVQLNLGYHEAALSPDGARLVVVSGMQLHAVDVVTGASAELGPAFEKYVQRIALSPDGLRVAVLYGETRVQVRDAETGEQLFERELSEHGSYFEKVSFSASGDEVLLEGSNALRCFDGYVGAPRWSEEHNQSLLGWRSGDDGTLSLLVLGSYNDVQLQTLDRRKNPSLGPHSTFRGLCASAQRHCFFDAQRAAVAVEGALLVLDARTGLAQLLEGHRNLRELAPDRAARALWHRADFYSLESGVLSDNSLLHPGNTREGYGLRTFALDTGEARAEHPLTETPGSLRAVQAPDGERLLVGSVGSSFALFDATLGMRWKTEPVASSDIGSALVMPGLASESLVVLSGSWTTSVRAFELRTGEPRWTLEREGASAVPRTNLVRLPDGTVLWLVQRNTSSPPVIECLELTASGEARGAGVLQCPMPFGVNTVDVTPDGAHLLAYAVTVQPHSYGTVGLWDLAQREFVGLVSTPQRDWLRALAAAPSGTLFATASSARLVHLWQLPTGRRLATLGVLERAVDRLAFSPDGATLLGAREDGVLLAWDVSGLCPRADAYTALHRAHAEPSPEHELRARGLLRLPLTEDALAAALALSGERGEAPPEGALTSELRDKLRKDFDRRVGRALEGLTT